MALPILNGSHRVHLLLLCGREPGPVPAWRIDDHGTVDLLLPGILLNRLAEMGLHRVAALVSPLAGRLALQASGIFAELLRKMVEMKQAPICRDVEKSASRFTRRNG